MSKEILLSSVPTAKIQLGNKGSIEIDTASVHGKKTIKLQFTSENDTVEKEIENIISDIKNEIDNVKEEINSSEDVKSPEELRYEMIENTQKHDREMLETGLGLAIPILAIIGVIIFAIFRSSQKRKWDEALLNKGFSPEEINAKNNAVESTNPNDLNAFEQRKHLKYAIVFGSLGIAILMGTAMNSFGYFIGFLGLFLGSGFYYFYKKGL
jgi:hypothetical protein